MSVGIAAAAALAQAANASGMIVRVEPADFERIVDQNNEALVVHSTGGIFHAKHHYLTSYRGLAFVTTCEAPLLLNGHCQVVEAKKMWLPV